MKYFIVFAFFVCVAAQTTDLQDACHSGKLRKVVKALEAVKTTEELNAKDEHYEETALHLAVMYCTAEEGERSIVDLMLEQKGIDVNKQDNEGYTPLHRAVLYKKKLMVEKLVEKTDLEIALRYDLRDEEGRNPLQLAIYHSKISVYEHKRYKEIVDILYNKMTELGLSTN